MARRNRSPTHVGSHASTCRPIMGVLRHWPAALAGSDANPAVSQPCRTRGSFLGPSILVSGSRQLFRNRPLLPSAIVFPVNFLTTSHVSWGPVGPSLLAHAVLAGAAFRWRRPDGPAWLGEHRSRNRPVTPVWGNQPPMKLKDLRPTVSSRDIPSELDPVRATPGT